MSDDPAARPAVLWVAGAGRSGTSTLAGLLRILGLRVPQPEVAPDPSNPKGFGEPRWVVDLHDGLLARAGVQVSDARPAAWFDTAEVCAGEPARLRATAWLAEQLGEGGDLLVKDPRLGWFLPLWRVASVRAGARPVFATVLRPPAEVVVSKQTYYANRLGAAHLAASWLNMQLHVERATRRPLGEAGDGARVLVRYADLLDDWVRVTGHLARTLDLPALAEPSVEQVREGHRFVDPGLRRMDQRLEDLDVPVRLRGLVEEAWAALDRLADPGGDLPEVHAVLDQVREAYVDLYEESEAISRSSVVAARQRRRSSAGTAEPPGVATPAPPTAPPGPRAADAVPHGLRALVPGPVRRGLRRAAGRPR